jgi:hypothetical protein
VAIGTCECCDRTNVPGSVVNCPGEPFACYLCQSDDVDPYCELEEACDQCGGDAGHAYPVDIDRRDGSLIERWSPCAACGATGAVPIMCEPIRMDDLEEIHGDEAR